MSQHDLYEPKERMARWRSRENLMANLGTRPVPYGTNLPIGSLWDGNDQQAGMPAILCLMAGGMESEAKQKPVSNAGHFC